MSLIRKRVPIVNQMQNTECGSACLAMVLRYYGNYTEFYEIRKLCGVSRDGVSLSRLQKVAESFGLECTAYEAEAHELSQLQLPAVLFWEDKHFVVLEAVDDKFFHIVDPGSGREKLTTEEFCQKFSKAVLVCSPTEGFIRKKAEKPAWLTFIKYLWTNRPLLIKVLSLSTLLLVFSLIFPFITQIMVDNLAVQKKVDLPLFLLGGIILAIVLNSVLQYIKERFSIRFEIEILKYISVEFVEHLFKLPMRFFENRSSGDLASRLNQISMLRGTMSGIGISFLLDIALMGIYLVAMLFYSPLLTIATLCVAFLHIVIMTIFLPQIRKLNLEGMRREGDTFGYLTEVLFSIGLVKYTGCEENNVKKWGEFFQKEINIDLKRGRLMALIDSLEMLLGTALPLMILWIGALLVIREDLSLGEVIGFNVLAASFLAPISELGMNILGFQSVCAAIDRLQDVINNPTEFVPEEKQSPPELKGNIEFKNVCFAYSEGGENVLNDINLKISPRQVIGIAGRTGSGKTTIAKLLLAMYQSNKGTISIDGMDLQRINPVELRQRLGVVPQEIFLYNESIKNNIAFHRPIPQETIEWAARTAMIHDEIMDMPMKYGTVVGENGKNLSGGQRQRITLARALAVKPSIMILDEASSQLDATTEQAIRQNLERLNVTQIIIAHRMRTISNADHILVLDSGRIVEQGSHAELLERQGLYAELLNTQEGSEKNIVNCKEDDFVNCKEDDL